MVGPGAAQHDQPSSPKRTRSARTGPKTPSAQAARSPPLSPRGKSTVMAKNAKRAASNTEKAELAPATWDRGEFDVDGKTWGSLGRAGLHFGLSKQHLNHHKNKIGAAKVEELSNHRTKHLGGEGCSIPGHRPCAEPERINCQGKTGNVAEMPKPDNIHAWDEVYKKCSSKSALWWWAARCTILVVVEQH